MNTEKISKILLWTMMGITIVVFVLFLLVGFDTPFEDNPKYNNPKLTDAVLILCYALTITAIVATIWSAIKQITVGGNSTSKDKGIAGRTGLISFVLLVVSLIIGVIVGIANKGETMLINGKDWNNPTDIIITDTVMVTIVILGVVSIIAVIYSMVATKK
jgi:quinol-cytochrome oxidoreductase complex cytochrome b subunit